MQPMPCYMTTSVVQCVTTASLALAIRPAGSSVTARGGQRTREGPIPSKFISGSLCTASHFCEL